MNKNLLINLILFIPLVTLPIGCTSSQWQVNTMATSSDQELEAWNEYNGEIPSLLGNWEVITEISDEWFSCDYQFILRYTTLTIDDENRIWIYGPDQWIGPNRERVPDAPDCEDLVRPRVIRYDQSSRTTQIINIELDGNAFLSSASGWSHIQDERTLLTSVFIYESPWDGSEGGAGNKYIDFAILENNKIRDLLGGNANNAVQGYSISENILYAISRTEKKIKILDLSSEQWIENLSPANCHEMTSIAVGNDNIFLLCRDADLALTLRAYTKELTEIGSWAIVENSTDLPIAIDAKGRLWVGDRYILKQEANNGWVLDGIAPANDVFIQVADQSYRRKIFGMFPYKEKMLFSLEGAIYLADYDHGQWLSIIHRNPPLPMAVGPDGKIYAFTGKYIISTKP
jgi:hypothetical protein